MDEFDIDAFKKAIGIIESSGGKHLSNPNSSAAGKYHFIYRYIKDVPEMKGVSKLEFMKDKKLQENIMDHALKGTLKGYPNYIKYSKELKKQFPSEKSNEQYAALIHFLGKGGVKKFLTDEKNFVVPGKENSSAKGYLEKFSENFVPTAPKAKAKNPEFKTPPQIKMPTNTLKNKKVEYNPSSNNDSLGFLQKLAYGGEVNRNSNVEDLIRFEGGGTHEENPLGGIPIGKNSSVEEGETMYSFHDGDYVFSNRLGFGDEFDNNKIK